MQRIRLDHHTLELQGTEQGLEGRALVGFAGVKQGLGNRHTELPRIERDLGNKPSCSIGIIGLLGRAPQDFAIIDQLIEILVLISDPGNHQLPEQPEKRLEVHPLKQIKKGGVAGCLGELQIQRRAECLVMPFGKTLKIPGAAAATEDAKNRHQKE